MFEEQTIQPLLNSMGSKAGSKDDQSKWFAQLKLLENYCETRGWTVEYSEGEDQAIPASNLIVLNRRHKPEILYYYFLHELGHMLMVIDDPDYLTKYKVLNERTELSQTFRVGRVEEEIEAWNKGFEFAQFLGLPVNQLKYEELKASLVSSYMLWAINRKTTHENTRRPRFIYRVYKNKKQ